AVVSRRHPRHPGLHPCPTRRSSDLFHDACPGQEQGYELTVSLLLNVGILQLGSHGVVSRVEVESIFETYEPPFSIPQPKEILSRSEEHTSELQSREKLVCRLLLEKK